MPTISLHAVTKSFMQGESRLVILESVDLVLKAGETVAISAPSGSGKSTLLNLIGCLDKPDCGKILIDGEAVATLSDSMLAVLRNRKIGFIFQSFHLIPVLTAHENVIYPLSLQQVSRAERFKRGHDILEAVGLGSHAHKKPHQLSGGQRQRVAIARALVTKPKIVLADEPTASLDADTADEIVLYVDGLVRRGRAMHNPVIVDRQRGSFVNRRAGQKWFLSTTLGVGYTTQTGLSLNLEYYYHGSGLNADEWRDVITLAQINAANLQQPGRGGEGNLLLLNQTLRTTTARNHYGFLRAAQPDLFDLVGLSGEITLFHGFDDGSGVTGTRLEYDWEGKLTLGLITNFRYGDDRSEFGLRNQRISAALYLTWHF